jgi:hypothetical protein
LLQVVSPGLSNTKEAADFFVLMETVSPIPPFAGFLAERLEQGAFFSPGQTIKAKFKVVNLV